MTIYNVHIYREMKLLFMHVEAATPEEAAELAKPLTLNDTLYEHCVEECEGETFAAVIDVVGDEDFSRSVDIDFEAERTRKAAPKVLEALRVCEGYVLWAYDHGADEGATDAALTFIRTVIAAADAAIVISASAGIDITAEE